MSYNNSEQTNMRRPKNSRSAVWAYFEISEDDSEIVQCLACDSRLRYAGYSTSAMRDHIQKNHVPAVPRGFNASEKQVNKPTFAGDNVLPQQGDQFLYAVDNSSQNATNKLFEMTVNDLLPISIVDGDAFKAFVHELNPYYVVPSSTTLASMVQTAYWKAQDRTKQQLQDFDHVSLGIEQWTKPYCSGHVCITITAFGIDAVWDVKPVVLLTRQIPERFFVDDFAELIQTCLTQFDIPKRKITGIVHDNTHRMQNICSQLSIGTICCVGSVLITATRKAFEVPAVKQILVTSRKVIGAFLKSEKLRGLVTEDISHLEKLLKDGHVNLNSTFDLIEFIANHADCIKRSFPIEYSVPSFNPGCWELILELKRLCDLLKRALNVVTSKDHVSASLVLPVINGLLTKSLLSSSILEKFKMVIKEELTRHFIIGEKDILGSNLHLMATALDPRFKCLKFSDPEQKQAVKTTIVKSLGEIQKKVEPETVSGDANGRSSKRAKLSDLSFIVGDVSKNEELVDDLSAVAELETFLSMPTLKNCDNPLDWWRIYQRRFPRLVKLAKRFLCMPASVFPLDTDSIDTDDEEFVKRRCMLGNDTTDHLILLHKNFGRRFSVDLLSGNNNMESEVSTTTMTTPEGSPIIKRDVTI